MIEPGNVFETGKKLPDKCVLPLYGRLVDSAWIDAQGVYQFVEVTDANYAPFLVTFPPADVITESAQIKMKWPEFAGACTVNGVVLTDTTECALAWFALDAPKHMKKGGHIVFNLSLTTGFMLALAALAEPNWAHLWGGTSPLLKAFGGGAEQNPGSGFLSKKLFPEKKTSIIEKFGKTLELSVNYGTPPKLTHKSAVHVVPPPFDVQFDGDEPSSQIAADVADAMKVMLHKTGLPPEGPITIPSTQGELEVEYVKLDDGTVKIKEVTLTALDGLPSHKKKVVYIDDVLVPGDSLSITDTTLEFGGCPACLSPMHYKPHKLLNKLVVVECPTCGVRVSPAYLLECTATEAVFTFGMEGAHFAWVEWVSGYEGVGEPKDSVMPMLVRVLLPALLLYEEGAVGLDVALQAPSCALVGTVAASTTLKDRHLWHLRLTDVVLPPLSTPLPPPKPKKKIFNPPKKPKKLFDTPKKPKKLADPPKKKLLIQEVSTHDPKHPLAKYSVPSPESPKYNAVLGKYVHVALVVGVTFGGLVGLLTHFGLPDPKQQASDLAAVEMLISPSVLNADGHKVFVLDLLESVVKAAGSHDGALSALKKLGMDVVTRVHVGASPNG